MLLELRVSDLGVIDDMTLLVGEGMTALTGETGAGKTLLVSAIELLVGGRGDPVLVRPGASEAGVEGRFAGAGSDAGDLVLSRVVPVEGRTRAYIDGKMSSSAQLAEAGATLVDLHGQHTHQSLLSPSVQRQVLDAFGGVDLAPLVSARRRLSELTAVMSALGGDARDRAREADLLQFQVRELAAAELSDVDEEERLAIEEERLADATALSQADASVHQLLAGDDGALDRVGAALAQVAARRPLEALGSRLRALEADIADVASEARQLAESVEEDPQRLAAIGARRHLLRELRRKYGDSLAEVVAFAGKAQARLAELASFEARAQTAEREGREAREELERAESAVAAARRAAAPALAAAVQQRLHALAMPRARFEVAVGDDGDGCDVTWLLGANPGEPVLPLTKVASGGELARTMLALRLATMEAYGGFDDAATARTLVFDEVDAGIGGQAAVAVGRALLDLAGRHQVLVVTHLPQVAAFADHHLSIHKELVGERTLARLEPLGGEARVVELSRMLSGQPDSLTARRHAEELLAQSRSRR
ncbi:MAG: DNA repair protein RecN [Acidimicrobiales bacterium]